MNSSHLTTMENICPGQSHLNTSQEQLLWESNDQKASTLIPAMVLIGFLIVIGLFGNILVCYVFLRHIRLSVSTLLLLVLACLDIMNCLLAMPFEIIDMRFFHVFPSDITCKIFRFLVAFPNINSMFILLIITVDRYKKVCKPLTPQMKFRDARLYIATATFFAILASLPSVCIYGLKTVETGVDGLYGTDCSTSDSMMTSVFPLIYQASGGCLVLVFLTILCYLYGCIWRAIQRHTRYVHSNTQLVLMSASQRHTLSNTHVDPHDGASQEVRDSKYKFASGHRITVIAFTVTLMFVLSNVPCAAIMVIRTVGVMGCGHDDKPCFVIYNILIRSFFISSIINPIVYGLMSTRFRHQCLKLRILKQFHDESCCTSTRQH